MQNILDNVNFAVSACDADGRISYINKKALEVFQVDKADDIVGRDIRACHPEPSRTKLSELMAVRGTQSYYTGSGLDRRFVHQTPLFEKGEYAGHLELIIPVLPEPESR